MVLDRKAVHREGSVVGEHCGSLLATELFELTVPKEVVGAIDRKAGCTREAIHFHKTIFL